MLLVAASLAGCGGGALETRGASDADAPTTPDAPAAPASPSEHDTAQADQPTRVTIETIGLDEPLIGLGIAGNGELEVPADPDDVGWFTDGGRPGGRGPTVIVGHLDSTTGPAVFAEVPTLDVGDTVAVTTAGGQQVTYAVDMVEDVPQGEFPTAAVFGATATDQLRLITCAGAYDHEAGRYTENRIVHASPR